uniref:Lipoprotein n=1 Tax=Marinomonas sp. (strain MWYL1) TaxID=400668 RepID=A6W319_MARMS
MFKGSIMSVTFSMIILSGCASTTHYNKERELTENSAVFIDAKQRGIFKAKKTKVNADGEGKIVWEGVCSEPVPGAISSLAATLGVDLSLTDKGKLGVSKSIAEGVSSIGIRTAAIEALRDIMYRNCEAYALGGISEFGIETLQRRFQSTMVAILAIEQLTGAVRAPATVLISDASAGSPEIVVDLTSKTELARNLYNSAVDKDSKSKESYDNLKAETAKTQKLIADGKEEADKIRAKPTQTDDEKKKLSAYDSLVSTQLVKNETEEKAAKKQYETDQSTTKERKQAYDIIDSARSAALASGGSATTSAQIETLAARPALSDDATKNIASTVLSIVEAVTSGFSYKDEVCVTLMGQNANTKPVKGSVLEVCRNELANGGIESVPTRN